MSLGVLHIGIVAFCTTFMTAMGMCKLHREEKRKDGERLNHDVYRKDGLKQEGG